MFKTHLSPETARRGLETHERASCGEGPAQPGLRAFGSRPLPRGLPCCEAAPGGHPPSAPGVRSAPPPASAGQASAVSCALPAPIPACATPEVAPANGTEDEDKAA